MTGKAIGGTLTVDAIAALTDEPDYRVRVNMSHAKLEEYAKQLKIAQKEKVIGKLQAERQTVAVPSDGGHLSPIEP